MARRAKLSESDRLRLADLRGKILPHGWITQEAERLGVAPATVWKYVNGQAGGSLRKLAPRPFEEGRQPEISGTPPDPLQPAEALPADPNLRVLVELRDNPEVPPADRVRSALALLGQGPGEETWSPPTSEDDWASILVEILKVQPAAVKAKVWGGRPE